MHTRKLFSLRKTCLPPRIQDQDSSAHSRFPPTTKQLRALWEARPTCIRKQSSILLQLKTPCRTTTAGWLLMKTRYRLPLMPMSKTSSVITRWCKFMTSRLKFKAASMITILCSTTMMRRSILHSCMHLHSCSRHPIRSTTMFYRQLASLRSSSRSRTALTTSA